MGLTQDEQKKIQEEEKIRLRTRNEQEAKGCVTIIGVLFLIIVFFVCLSWFTGSLHGDRGSLTTPNLLPAVQTFIKDHPELGSVVTVANVPDWAQGKRQRVTMRDHTGPKDYLFYEQNNEIVSVYLITEDRGRIPVYGK